MKLNRMLEIVTVLLNRKSVTAAELAERFGVSVRTVYRDIEALSSSGVPVYTTQGAGGGISIMEDYSVSRAMLSESERTSVMFALRSLQSTKYPGAEGALEKLAGAFKTAAADWISVDFSPWGSNPNAYNKFNDIKSAILNCGVIEIDYINAKNEHTTRKIEPLRLDFKYQAWYLWGWCRDRHDYRTFRISRIKRVAPTGERFDRFAPREKSPAKAADAEQNNFVHCVLRFTSGALFRLYDDYDDDRIKDNGDGTYTLEVDFPEDDWVYGYILSFGTNVQVIEPEHIKQIISQKAAAIANFYSKPDNLTSGMV
jgi:Predicted transcriptional regulator